MVEVAVREAQRFGLAASGDTIVIVAGTPPHGKSGRTNTRITSYNVCYTKLLRVDGFMSIALV